VVATIMAASAASWTMVFIPDPFDWLTGRNTNKAADPCALIAVV
jgi:hypothetical protein